MKTTSLQVDLPDWMNWIAQNADGTWAGYAEEPKVNRREWRCEGARSETIAFGFKPNLAWRTTLKRI